MGEYLTCPQRMDRERPPSGPSIELANEVNECRVYWGQVRWDRSDISKSEEFGREKLCVSPTRQSRGLSPNRRVPYGHHRFAKSVGK